MLSTLLHSTLTNSSLEKKIIRKWPNSSGVDILADSVYNACKGSCVFVGLGTDNRYCVSIQIDSKQIIRYCHLKSENVSPNEAVDTGILIGIADKYVRIEYCTSDSLSISASNIVRIEGCAYFKVDPYNIVIGKTPITIDGISAYDQAQSGLNTDYTQFIKTEAITPYIATLGSDVINKSKFQQIQSSDSIVGVMLYGGGLYDVSHIKKRKYRSLNIDKQVKFCDEYSIPYGLYVDVRARSIEEAKEECTQLFYIISKYPPKLGLWLQLDLVKSTSMNDNILSVYQEKTYDWGLNG